jgi:prenyltransferase beta subunit
MQMFAMQGKFRNGLMVLPIIIEFLLASTTQAIAAPRTAEEIQIDKAISKSLKFLASQQVPSGAWRIDSYGESTAATSLAVMAFLAAGHVPGEGPYGKQINQGVAWVLDHQLPNGMLVHRKSHGPMYSHGISTLMLAEVVGMVDKTMSKRCRMTLEKAAQLILDAQNVTKDKRNAGGWRYSQTSADSDLSVTGWQLLALRAAKNVGCDIPAESIDKAIEYVKNCNSARSGFGYQPGHRPTHTITGVGILSLEVCGDHHAEESLEAAEWLLENPLQFGDRYYFYGVYYCTVGMFKMGDKYWDETREQVFDDLLSNQSADGSWQDSRGTEKRYGKIYSTSLSLLALAVEYRYLPIYQR